MLVVHLPHHFHQGVHMKMTIIPITILKMTSLLLVLFDTAPWQLDEDLQILLVFALFPLIIDHSCSVFSYL